MNNGEVADGDRARRQHLRIQCQPSTESPADILQHVGIDVERVRIDRRHGTAAAPRVQMDARVADLEHGPGPVELLKAGDATDHDVGTKPTAVSAERGDGAVCGDQQRQDVEPVFLIRWLEPRVVSCCLTYERKRLRALPRIAFDERLTVQAKGSVKAKQTMVTARGADTFRPTDPDEPIARNAAIAQVHAFETLAGQRLDWKSPELGQVHIS